MLVRELLDRGRRDARRADPVRAHPDRLLASLLVEVTGSERLGVAEPELEDVADLDRRLDRQRRPADRVPGLDGPYVDRPKGKVPSGPDAAQVGVRTVRPRHVAALARGGLQGGLVEEDLHLSVEAHRADVADRSEVPGDLLRPGRARLRAQGVRELDLVDAVIPAHEYQHDPSPVGPQDHREGLQQGPVRELEMASDLLDRDQSRGAPRHRLIRGPRQGHRAGLGRRHLDVRRIPGGDRDLVLARGAGGHVLVGAEASHHAHVAQHPVPAQAAAFHDAVVGLHVQPVALVQALAVAVEAVGVLHDELPRAQDPGPGAGLVALLELDVVEDQRQVPVGAHDLRHVRRDRLLVGHREHELRVLAVEELEQLRDGVPAGQPPQLGWLQERHQELLPSNRVHLLPDDLDGPLVGAPAGR